ncbi:hypothetical protein Bbelb_324750 [Branchiostoma belcheri]|nr:hypothetical protein Bbelb_324750 [Branchiostoma belcheri]
MDLYSTPTPLGGRKDLPVVRLAVEEEDFKGRIIDNFRTPRTHLPLATACSPIDTSLLVADTPIGIIPVSDLPNENRISERGGPLTRLSKVPGQLLDNNSPNFMSGS